MASIPDEHLVWDTVATYLAIACLNTTFLLSPEVIVLEGGVMQRSILYPKIRAKFLELLNNYIDHPLLKEGAIDNYIVKSKHIDTPILSAISLSL